jgi:hypothetical protein
MDSIVGDLSPFLEWWITMTAAPVSNAMRWTASQTAAVSPRVGAP